jgi:predicted Zn-dependent protease
MKKRFGSVLVLALAGVAPAVCAIDLGGILSTAQRIADTAKPVAADPAAQEKLLGEEAAREILSRAPLAPLPGLQRYVNQLGRYLAAGSGRTDVDWRFAVIDDASANAWAAPDGYVFVTTGMLADVGSEAELAGVLAHEIEHVVQRHHLKAIQAASRRGQLAELAGIAQDTAAAEGASTVTVNPELEKLRGTIGQLYERGLSRGDELDADRRGVELAGQRGYDPYGLMLVLQKLGAHGKDDASLASFTRTHPSIEERLKKLEAAVEDLDPAFFPGRTQEERYRKNARF